MDVMEIILFVQTPDVKEKIKLKEGADIESKKDYKNIRDLK